MNSSLSDLRKPRYAALALTAAVVLLLLFFYHVVETLALLLIAILFAIYLGGLTDFFQKRFRIGRHIGLLLAIFLTGLGISAIVYLILPALIQQVRDLAGTLPTSVAGWTTYLLELGETYPVVRGVLPDAATIEQQIHEAQRSLTGSVRELIPVLFDGVGVLIHFVSVIVMSIYLTLHPTLYTDGLVRLIPVRRRALARSILQELGVTLRAWIGAQLVAMVILAVLTWVGLVILGVPFALAFGVFTGVAVVVPFFGTLVSTVLPALFVLGLDGPLQALLVLLLGVVVHLVEANVVHPLIMQRQIRLPPVLSIVSVLVMADLFGGVGLVLAVPVLAVVMVITRRVYVEEILEKKRRRRRRRSRSAGETESAPLVQVQTMPSIRSGRESGDGPAVEAAGS